jgi:putative ABC transport system ATP-binding protein
MLEFDSASKRYLSPGGAIQAVDGVNVLIGVGEFVAIFGPSGSGKSTLLSLASGLLTADQGAVRFQGRDLAALRKREILAYRRNDLGLVFQDFELVDGLTAQENVAVPLLVRKVPRAEAEDRAGAVLAEVGLPHRRAHLVEKLSGGEQQRVAIARALVGEPTLVLADEPTGNLDSETGERVLSLLRELTYQRGVAMVLATHDAQAAAFADRVMEMRDGQLSADVTV